MSREVHVRFCESAGVRIPRATRLEHLFEPPGHGLRRVATVFYFKELPARYQLSWYLHLACLKANITNEYVTLSPDDGGMKCHPVLLSYRETEGEWLIDLTNRLGRISLETEGAKTNTFFHLLGLSLMASDISYVVDPAVDIAGIFNKPMIYKTKCHMTTLGEAIKESLGLYGLMFRLQGGVMYITKEEKVRPNKTSEPSVAPAPQVQR